MCFPTDLHVYLYNLYLISYDVRMKFGILFKKFQTALQANFDVDSEFLWYTYKKTAIIVVYSTFSTYDCVQYFSRKVPENY